MKKSAIYVAAVVMPLLGASLVTQSCGNGESVNTSQSSGSTGSGGSSSGNGNASGNGSGSGGTTFVTVGSGGANVNQGSGGQQSGSSSGGSSASGGAGTSSGGSNVIVGSGSGGSTIIVGTGTGSGGTAATTGGTDSLFSTAGYGMNTDWMGYVYTSQWGTATIAPLTPGTPLVGNQVCVNGSVPADPTNTGASGILVGWNLSQARTSTTPATWTPTGTGVAITLSTMVTGARVQIEDATQKMTWCYNLTGPTTMIPWAMFNTTCYNLADPKSAAFSPTTPIRDIAVEIPASSTTIPFNFCWINAARY
jgi:hypothetical protein